MKYIYVSNNCGTIKYFEKMFENQFYKIHIQYRGMKYYIEMHKRL